MTASTVDRQTVWKHVERELTLDLKSGETIPAGVMVCRDAAGDAVNASDTAGLIMQGISTFAVSYAAGDRKVVVRRGSFWMANDGNVVAAQDGGLCYVLDNQTVTNAATAVQDIKAGYIDELNTSRGVLVTMLGGAVGAT